jgi:hypothetical protein
VCLSFIEESVGLPSQEIVRLSFIEESVGLPSQEIVCLRGIHYFSPSTILHYVIKFVNDLRQVVSFPRFPPPRKLTAAI